MQMWEYLVVGVDELRTCGLDGWEAVCNVASTQMGNSTPRILLKRPLGPIEPSTNQNTNNEIKGVSVGEMSSGLYSVILTDGGEKKIAVIGEVRTLTNLGLKGAKDLVDGAPKLVLEKVSRAVAANAKAALEAAGAKVSIK